MSESLTELHTHEERLREEVAKVRQHAGTKIDAFLTLAHMSAVVLIMPNGVYEDVARDREFDPLEHGSIR